MNYYKHHIGDYRRDTSHLSLLEHGIYRQLLDQYYLDEKPLPAETESVIRRLSARTDEEKKAVETVLKEFFVLQNGWHHKRCEMELNDYRAFAEQARKNGTLGGRPRKTETVLENNRTLTETKPNRKLTTNHKPITTNQETTKPLVALTRSDLPDYIGFDIWELFLKHRGKKFSLNAQQLTIKQLAEFHQLGQDCNKILETSIANGWKGVFAEKGKVNGYHNERDESRKRTIRELTGYDPDAIKGVSTRID